jgi:nitrogen fixation NifU-like protein
VTGGGLEALYQGLLLEHARTPRNFRALDGAHKGEARNRVCGDGFEVYVQLDGDRIADIAFQGTGCAISVASASLMTEQVKGTTVAGARTSIDLLLRMLATPPGTRVDDLDALTALEGVRQFPVRIRCATLAWEALREALRSQPLGR